MAKIKISELPQLISGSINTILVGNEGNNTYKIPLSVITQSVVELLSASADHRLDLLEQFESDFLPFSSSVHTQIINATNEQNLSFLATTASVNQLSSSLSNRIGIIETFIDPPNWISSSQQISDLGFVTGSYVEVNQFNSFTQSYYTDSSSFNNSNNPTSSQSVSGSTSGGGGSHNNMQPTSFLNAMI